MNFESAPIIEKWYKALGFDKKYDPEFYEALRTIPISADTDAASYDYDCQDGKKNLLSFLYMCEAVAEQYWKKGISTEILMDTLSDIVRWSKVWSEITGELCLFEIGWLYRHMRLRLFTLGRLQFCIETATEQMAQYGMTVGESYISIHIPSGGPLQLEECKASLEMARSFFDKYFPDMKYSWFSCNSWLLDESLQKLLPPESNILQFAALFRVVGKVQSDDIIRFVFRWDANRENIDNWDCSSGFAKKVKACVAQGQIFYQTRGLLPK